MQMDYKRKLEELLHKLEDEVVEFKAAKEQFDFGKLGKYFSALSNEANLRGIESAWIVFGVEDKTHQLVGTSWLSGLKQQLEIKKQLGDQLNDGIAIVGIHELIVSDKRILLFEIPAAPRGIPTSFKGHFYGRQGESILALGVEKIERIRRQGTLEDWSQGIIPDATLADLDPAAIFEARIRFLKRHRLLNRILTLGTI